MFLGILIMIMVTSIGAIAAADDYESVGDYTFDIPDGYQVVDKDDVSVGMELDENHTVLVYQLDAVSDINFFKSMLESAGCEFGDAQELKVGNFEATQSTYKFDETQGYFYICSDGGKPIVVADGMTGSEELPAVELSPAYQVVNSLE
jgi:hypothetical protein